MKKNSLLFALLLSFLSVSAQLKIDENPDDEKIETISGSFDIYRISGFGGPIMSFANINNNYAFMMGGGGGVYINQLFLGGYGEGLASKVNMTVNEQFNQLQFGHGGLWIGYEFAYRKLLHPIASLRGGWGTVDLSNNYTTNDLRNNIFVLTPSVGVEMNLTQFMKISANIEYRQVFGVNTLGPFNSKDFSGLQFNLRFIFGWFN